MIFGLGRGPWCLNLEPTLGQIWLWDIHLLRTPYTLSPIFNKASAATLLVSVGKWVSKSSWKIRRNPLIGTFEVGPEYTKFHEIAGYTCFYDENGVDARSQFRFLF